MFRRFSVALVALTVALGGLVGTGLPAQALIATATGNVILLTTAPASVKSGALQNATSVFAFNEKQGVTLATSVGANFSQPGTYDQTSDFTFPTIPAGTVVDSHFVHSNNVGVSNSIRDFTLTFPTDILGVVVGAVRLDQSDFLGAVGTAYPGAGDSNRGLEFSGSGADIVVLADHRTVHGTVNTTGSLDQMRIITKHNSPPTVSAGGPYAGVEGSPVSLAGTATDTDGDPLTKSWALAWTGSPGTSCSATGTTTLTPAVTCTDNALVTATLTVNDGVNAPVTSVANVTIANVAPTLGTLTVPGAATPLGTAVNVSAPFTDPGSHDSHTATITWGDTTSSAGSITETGGNGTASGSHVYAAPGLYTVRVTVTDKDLGTVSASAQVAVNGPPTADAGGPYNGDEGLAVGLVGTATDPENNPLSTDWTFTPSGLDAGGTCTATGATSLIPSITCTDDAVVTAALTANDGINPPVSSTATVTIDNQVPVLGPVAVDAGPIPTGQQVTVTAPFTDGGTNDTHTAIVTWGDLTSSTATITEGGGVGALQATHSYTTPGAYSISVVLTDDDLAVDSGSTSVLVNSRPTADAGGPYVGAEGATLALSGTATDVDGDPLTTMWSFTTTGGPGTTCTPTGADTLTPSLVCNDDATVDATLTVDDGVNPAVTSSTTITVGNSAPDVSALTVPSGPVPIGTSASAGLTFTDPGTNDTHLATVTWGDSTSSSATLSEAGGAGSALASHTYTAYGVFHVTMTVTDDNGAATSSTADIVVNGRPVATAGVSAGGTEGSGVRLDGTATDPDDSTLDVGWTFTWTGDPGTLCTATGADTLSPLVTCTDDATVTATLTVNDRINPPVVTHTTFSVTNVAPTLTPVVPSASPVATGSTVSVGLALADPGTNDTHTATVAWGDSTTSDATVVEADGGGTVSAEHVFPTHGTYHVTVTVTDDNGGTATSNTDIVVNGQPVVGAGGPYHGVEGAGVTLSGTAVDPEADALAVTWTYSVSGADPGTVCSLTDEHTLTPVVSCTDDALVSTTLTATDGVNPPVVDHATVDIVNARPAVSTPVVLPNPVAVGGTVSVSSAFTDQGINDDHVASINWGDATSSPATVSETLGAGGTATGSHSYTVAGTYLVKVTVNDKDGGSTTATTTVIVSAPPVVHAGGPYHGVEGTPTALAGSATDPEGDALTLAWSITWTGGSGTVCSLSGAETATPTVLCNDDAVVTAKLKADDGLNAPVSDTATLTVANAAPNVGAVTAPGGAVPVGTPATVSAAFGDAGTNDTHVASVSWGDAATTTGAVLESGGSGAASASHSYATAGTYLVTVTITDDNGGVGTGTATLVVNGAPVVVGAGPYSGVEGSPVTLHATASDPNGDSLSIGWTFTWVGGPGTTCTATAVTTLAPSVTCNDDATVTARLSVSDGVNPAVVRTATVNIANVAPTIGVLTVPVAPVPLGSAATALATFADAGRNDTHTATVSWGDATTSAGTISEVSGSGSTTASHVYPHTGTYTVSVTVRDDNGGTVIATATTAVVIYDRSNSFVTGGGWINSPSGAYTPGNSTDPDLVGRGNFGFVARYPSPTAAVPTGETEFQLRIRKPHSREDDEDERCRVGDRWDDDETTSSALDFHSTGYVILVVDAGKTKAYYRGTGTVNGVSGYEFLVSVVDGRNASGPDRFRIKVWKTSTGVVLYDNQAGAADDATATAPVSGGSIVIH